MRASVEQVAILLLLLIAAGCGDESGARGDGASGGQPSGSGVAPMGSYQATITMAQPTVDALASSGYYLYVLKAIGGSDAAGQPLIWLRTQQYSLSTVIQWQEQYSAYTAFTPIAPPTPISIGASYALAPGQILDVQSSQGLGGVHGGGQPGTLEIDNQTTKPFTCGISQPHQANGGEDDSSPIGAFPLYGRQPQIFTPVAKVLLLFSTIPVAPGTPVEVAFDAGVLIDLGEANTRAVSYDINEGWSWGGLAWAQPVADHALLVPLLIEPLSTM